MPPIKSVSPDRDVRAGSVAVDVRQFDLTQLFGCDLVASACARALQHVDPANVRQDFGGGMPPLEL